MTRIRIEDRDPWGVRDRDDVFTNTPPTTRASMRVPASEGVRIGWSVFWRSLWWVIQRKSATVEFWMEGER